MKTTSEYQQEIDELLDELSEVEKMPLDELSKKYEVDPIEKDRDYMVRVLTEELDRLIQDAENNAYDADVEEEERRRDAYFDDIREQRKLQERK